MAEKEMSDSRKRAIRKYLAKFIDMKIRVTPEEHAVIKQHAETMGESSAAFIKRAITETMERDNQSGSTPE